MIFVDTTVMLPIAIDYAKKVSDLLGWNLTILRPAKDFFEQAAVKGMPWVKRRWCCYDLKLQPIFDFVRPLKPQRAMATGLRQDESANRQKKITKDVFYDTRRQVNAWNWAPIREWSEKDVLTYIEKHDLPMPPHYKLGIKETCMCGAFSSKREVEILRAEFPELFQKFVELEGKFQSDWACFWSGKPIYAHELAKQTTFSKVKKDE